MDKNWLKELKIFSELKSSEWAELSKIIEEKDYVEGDIIFNQGDKSTELYILKKGLIELQIKIAPQLAESTVYTVKEHDLFGEFAFIDPKPRSATARCMKDSTVEIIKKEDFDELTKNFPNIGLNFYKNIAKLLSERLRRMNNYVREVFLRSCGLEI